MHTSHNFLIYVSSLLNFEVLTNDNFYQTFKQLKTFRYLIDGLGAPMISVKGIVEKQWEITSNVSISFQFINKSKPNSLPNCIKKQLLMANSRTLISYI
jgi:hypothetical protein